MTLDRWRIVEQIVGNTLELERPQRPAYLDAVCGADRELRTEVERILAGDSEEFLERPPSLLQDLLDEAGEDWVFEPGEQVAGRFRIVRWLAHGGMGEVYEAEDNELPGVRVALKTVRGHIAWSENLRQQFRREVELARKVTHPNVCRIYDLTRHQKRLSGGGEEDALVLSMELLEGETLSEVLRREGPMPLDAARPIAMGILDALAAAHAAGVMHGDLKPNNIMLVCEQGARRPIVMDFGLAHQVQERGIAGGAPAYMAPEQLTGGQTTAATDIYSFGAIIFEMLTGGQWPREESHGEPPGSGQLDRRWGAVASRCLEREPEARFQSVLEVRQALAAGGGMTRRYVLVGASMLTSAAALFGYRRLAERNSRAIVAVLPFENAGGSPDNRYFIEGLADEIRECLARVPGLRVIARTSSEEAGRSLMSLVGAGERLRASYLVSGSGRRDGQTVALTVRLVDARTGLELWRRDYRKADVDAMSARSDVAATLVPALGFQLRKEVTSQLAPGRTTNTAAFDQYVRARGRGSARHRESAAGAGAVQRGLRARP
jgi:eukaryotic-like serine/threonine-protein kinase